MLRGVGGGGSHSSFSHSSFGGTHSSYHHSSSSSSSSFSHHSHSSSSNNSSSYHHSSYTPKPNVTHNTTNVFVNTVDNSNSDKKSDYSKPKNSYYHNNYDYDTYEIVKPKILTRAEREYDDYLDAKSKYDEYKNQIEADQKYIDTTTEYLNKLKSNILYKYNIIIILLSVLLSISTVVFFILSITDIHKIVTDSFIPLNSDQCILSDEWYTDNWGTWISDEDELLEGLKYFYERTGAQPYIYITGPEGNNYSLEEAVRELAETVYKSKFTDGGHIVLIFREYPDSSGDWYGDVYSGNAVTALLGQETSDIIMDNLVKYYEYTSLSDEEFFSETFKESANDIRDKFISKSYKKDDSFVMNIIITIILFILSIISYVIIYKSNELVADVTNNYSSINRRKVDMKNTTHRINDLEHKVFKTIKCPNCGAKVNINYLGKGRCEYCDIDIVKTASDIKDIIGK